MFNNPFESFHDTVAEAKEEREQLDRLLIISTPRERVLVALVFLTVIAFGAWLAFGSVAQRVSIDGVVVGPVGNSDDSTGLVEVAVWIGSVSAANVEVGMPASIRLTGRTESIAAAKGEVKAIASSPIPSELSTAESVSYSYRRFDIVVDTAFMHSLLVPEKCVVDIEIGRQSPLTMIGAGLL